MVKITVALSLLGVDRCVDVREIQIDDSCTLTELNALLEAQMPGYRTYLLYRGCRVSRQASQMALKECCPAAVSSLRFSARRLMDVGCQVFVETPDKTLTYRFLDNTSVLELKQMVYAREGIPTESFHLISAGRHLSDCQILSECDMQEDATVKVVPNWGFSGRDRTGYTLDVRNTSTLQQLSLSQGFTTAPTWRKILRGLNIEGRCQNTYCRAYQSSVIAYYDNVADDAMCSISFLSKVAKCPVCNECVQSEACGFTDCIFAYDCNYTSNGGQLQDLEGEWQHVPADQYQRFGIDLNAAKRHTLVVCVRRKPGRSVSDQQIGLDCPVCHRAVSTLRPVDARCGHKFHHSCFIAWKRFQPSIGCPKCKNPILQVGFQGSPVLVDGS